MNLQKATKDLQARIDGEFNIKGVDDCKDMKLGIEALEEIRRARVVSLFPENHQLPGETKE